MAGRAVRLTCGRHLKDLETGAARGLTFDIAEAQRVLDFFENHLCLAADRPLQLQPAQKFVLGSLFGWKAADGYRRFRQAYIEIGKGNGKTPLAAGIGLYGLVADGEYAAEVYSAAVTREQARILFSDAKQMVDSSPELQQLVKTHVGNISVGSTYSFFRAISSEKRGLDGKRVHMALIDEVHEHPDAIVVDKMRAGTKGRKQALIIEITNSGYDRHSVAWHHHEYSLRVLEGAADNDAWFSYVCQLDEGDNWADPKVWIKANPLLGVTLTEKYLAEQVREAQGMPSKQNIVRRLNFCEWTEQAERAIDLQVWDACAGAPIAIDDLRGRPCYLGLDLSSTTDLSSLVALFPNNDDGYDVLPFFWLPEDSASERIQKARVEFDVWIRDGHILLTPGNVIDYDAIKEKVLWCVEHFDVRELAFDPWNATQLVVQLEQEGVQCFPMRQGFASMAAPTKEVMRLILGGLLHHGGHPVLRFNVANASTEQDAAGNLKFSKSKSTEHIDGLIALTEAVDRAMRHAGADGPAWFEKGIVTA